MAGLFALKHRRRQKKEAKAGRADAYLSAGIAQIAADVKSNRLANRSARTVDSTRVQGADASDLRSRQGPGPSQAWLATPATSHVTAYILRHE